ncbi:MAG TPA: ATP-binding protein [Polyangiaceae bacterium]|nr:ATP-binding protein [Polyangiaceae bacterium]
MGEPEEDDLPYLGDDADPRPEDETGVFAPDMVHKEQRQVPCFVVVGGETSVGSIIKLSATMILGRSTEADIPLLEEGVSRRHAAVTALPTGRVFVRDLDSRNGIYFNGERVHEALVSPGDRVAIGGAVLMLVPMNDALDAAWQGMSRLERERDELAELERLKREFVATVSHELRTPLALVLGPLENVLDRPDLPAWLREPLMRGYRNAGRLSVLVDDLLDLSKLEAKRLEAFCEPIDVTETLEAMVQDAAPTAEARGLALEVHAMEGLVAHVDPVLFDKVLLNLLTNALKFTPPGGWVTLVAQREHDEVIVEVRDTGVGIPEEAQPLLFERFRQIDGSHTRRHEGTGLGLSLVKELTELMNGSVAIESSPEEGSTFIVRFPASDEAPRHRARAREGSLVRDLAWHFDPQPRGDQHDTEQPPPPEEDPRRPYVVVAEDNADMRSHLRELLAAEYNVIAVPDGRAALAAIQRHRPAAVVSDVMMPDMDGLDLVRAVRGDPVLARTPVILLTARGGSRYAADALDLGADDYVAKPFGADELLARLRTQLRLRKAEATLAVQLDELQEARKLLIELYATGH